MPDLSAILALSGLGAMSGLADKAERSERTISMPGLSSARIRKHQCKQKGRTLRKSSLVRADLLAQGPWEIPTPPRATTKLFVAACVPTSRMLRKKRRRDRVREH
jgi:hypothetical protein